MLIEVFTKEDIEFNRKMVDLALSQQEIRRIPGVRQGRKIQNQIPSRYVRNRDCVSDIINEFRSKWGIVK